VVVHSVGEDHQPRVENDWQEDVASDVQSERNDQSPFPSPNSPLIGYGRGSEDDHHRDCQEADGESQLEVIPDSRNFQPE